MKLENLKIKALDVWNDEYHYSENFTTLSEFFKKVEYIEKRKNCIKIELFTGFKDKKGNDIYFGDKVKGRINDELLPGGGWWWEAEVKQVNGCAVLLQIGFDYSDSNFPNDYTFLYEDVTEIELIK